MAETVLAAVRTAPSTTEIREFPMPDIPEDSALMKMEVAGICGTDVKLYKTPPTKDPVIMGHENIGYIAKAGREFTRRKGFKEGDLVFVEHYVMCGKCEWCHQGQYRHCENTDWRSNPEGIRYGYTSAAAGAAPLGRLRPIRLPALELGRAPRAEGRHARACGPRHAHGQRGRMVPVRRRRRLQLDRADPGPRPAGPVADRHLQAGGRLPDHRHRHVQGRAPAWRWRRSSAPTTSSTSTRRTRWRASWRSPAGKGVDVVLDCTAGAGTIPILLGIEALKRKGGRIVAQGEMADFPNFPIGKFTVKFITMTSARGHSYRACELALEQIASQRFPLEMITTHRFGLKDVDLAIRSVGNQGVPGVIHASLMPWE